MWSLTYKGFVISGHMSETTCSIFAGEVHGVSYQWRCSSLMAAKQKITRMIKLGISAPEL